jgi:phosphatidylserine decarboxylase
MLRAAIASVVRHEDVNFLLTNRIPRRMTTNFFGWFSQIENPLVRDLSISVWRLFTELDLSDARETRFRSLHDCFIRRLRDGARPIDPDPDVLVSPCDAIVGASGRVEDGQVLQIKGFPYQLCDLLGDDSHAERYRNGCYVTLRLTSAMYHRFHAPHDCTVEAVSYISGDTWNVNPIALKRVERLFCKNERAVLQTHLATGEALTLVPVAAILVASIRLHFIDRLLNAQTRGPVVFPCDASVAKGDELGWFEHGSTIIVLTPDHFEFCANIADGARIRAGQPLMRKPGYS